MAHARNPVAVLLLGGQENALSLVRSFGQRGITVNIAATSACLAFKSRYCGGRYQVPHGMTELEYWRTLLLEDQAPELHGSVIFPCSDEALEFVAANHPALAARFLLDDARPALQRAMLNKLDTLELARRAGCPTPAFLRVDSLADLDKARGLHACFPLMLKPLHSHLFRRRYPNQKYLLAADWRELRGRAKELLDQDLQFMLCELIPGPDDLHSAYFTYITADGRELFRYTHHIIRRYPCNSGNACLTVTRKLADTAMMGRRFFHGIGFRGLGHVEFKRDPRDGQLKIMECNARTSAAQAIVTGSGLDMGWCIYDYLVNGNTTMRSDYRSGVRRWWFLLDLWAYRELRARGELDFVGWLRSVKGPPLVFPYFSLRDPLPFLHKAWRDGAYFLNKRIRLPWQPAKESPAPR